jgi:hypothetical protein
MQKVILTFVMLLILIQSKSYGQIFVNSNNEESDTTFNLCSLTSDICEIPSISVNCSNWEGNATLHYRTCIEPYIQNSQLELINKNFCSMSVINDMQAENIYATICDLEPGVIYRLGFYQRNIFDELFSNEYDGFTVENKKARFKVTIGDTQIFYSEFMDYPNDMYFHQQLFNFTADNTCMSLVVEAIPEQSDRKVYTRLALDEFSIEEFNEVIVDPIITDPIEVPQPCEDCSSFELVPNEKYVVSGWVKQTNASFSTISTISYTDSYIEVDFQGTNTNYVILPEGEMIDGWQRMSAEITIPISATEVDIKLKNDSQNLSFFDDIRIHPFNSNLKSFVYDQATQRLMAELDENNYATFYEYDNEGGLIRVKKETAKGIFTIQETRSSTIKNE